MSPSASQTCSVRFEGLRAKAALGPQCPRFKKQQLREIKTLLAKPMGNIAADMLADGGGDAGDAGLGDAADAFFGGLSGGSVSMSVEAGGAGLAATVPPTLGDGTDDPHSQMSSPMSLPRERASPPPMLTDAPAQPV